jgi:iron-sulfur cluster repair protein YtfE (RIC family)
MRKEHQTKINTMYAEQTFKDKARAERAAEKRKKEVAQIKGRIKELKKKNRDQCEYIQNQPALAMILTRTRASNASLARGTSYAARSREVHANHPEDTEVLQQVVQEGGDIRWSRGRRQ